MAELNLQKIKKALEEAAKYKKKYEDLLSGKAVSDQIMETISENLGSILAPVFEELAKTNHEANQKLVAGIKDALMGNESGDSKDVVSAIQAGFRGLRFPTPRVEVNVPDIIIPEPKDISSSLPSTINAILDYSDEKPLPVKLMGPDGKAFQFSAFAAGGGQGSGRGNFFKLDYTSADPLPVTITSGAGATTAVNLSDSSGVGYSGSNPLPVAVITDSDASSAAYLLDGDGNYRGTLPVAIVSNAVATSAVNMVDSSGVAYSGSNPLPITGPVVVSSITATTTTRLDSPDGAYSGSNPLPVVLSGAGSTSNVRIDTPDGIVSGSNPLPITIISGALASTAAVGDSAARSADNGGNPVKIGGIARQTNPTAFADGDRANMSTDDVGRQVIRTHQVRDLVRTAYVTLSTGTETTLLAAQAGAFLDLLYVMGANTSSAAVQVDIRAVTAGNVVATLYIPANSTAGVSLPVAWPQDATGNNWTVDMGDFTNSNVLISALFSQEV